MQRDLDSLSTHPQPPAPIRRMHAALTNSAVLRLPAEITAFSDRHNEFKEMNTEVLGVSVDSQFTHLAWIQTDRKVRACTHQPIASGAACTRNPACMEC